MEVTDETSTSLEQNESKESEESSADREAVKKRYYLYRMFWGLQSFMSAENNKFVADDPNSPPVTTSTSTSTTIGGKKNSADAARAALTATAKARWLELMVGLLYSCSLLLTTHHTS